MSKHTPGPWEVSPQDPCRVNVVMNTLLHPDEPRVAETDEEKDDDRFHDDWNICQCDGDYYSRSSEECEANARLIAVAPDLLSCLLAYVELEEQSAPASSSPMRERAREAIAKAEGKAVPS